MSKFIKRGALAAGIVAGLFVLAFLVGYFLAGARLYKVYGLPDETIPIPAGEAALERGKRLVAAVRCTECHGPNLAGQVMEDNPVIGRFVAANLTNGKGGVGAQFGVSDWVRALRHGVGPDGQSLIITPAQYYYYLNDDDLGAMIYYLQRLSPVDKELPPSTLGPVGRLILLLPTTDWLPAEKIDHTALRPAPVPEGVTVEYGQYLVRIANCQTCHGSDYGDLSGWDEAAFIHAMRTGYTPDDYQLDRGSMPWRNIGQMTDKELKAVWLYLETLKKD